MRFNRLSFALASLLLATACNTPSSPTTRGAAPAASAPPAPQACIKEGEACNRVAGSCCSGMICVGGDAGACMPAN